MFASANCLDASTPRDPNTRETPYTLITKLGKEFHDKGKFYLFIFNFFKVFP